MNPKMKSAIEKITLNDATFSNEVIEPTYVNFFYGKNGAGKSTIARTFKANDERLQWQAGKASTDYDVLVYDTDFINANLRNYGNLAGVFTVNETNIAIQEQVDTLNAERKKMGEEYNGHKAAIDQKTADKNTALSTFQSDCWSKSAEARTLFDEAIKGKKKAALFAQEILAITPVAHDVEDLKTLYGTVFSGDAQQYNMLSKAGKVTYASLPGYELMGKPISSSSDTDFAKFIKALKATDWVRSGHTHFAGQTDGKCPYCQQKLPSNFDKEIAACFDAQYQDDISAINAFQRTYESEMDSVVATLEGNVSAAMPELDLENAEELTGKEQKKLESFQNNQALYDEIITTLKAVTSEQVYNSPTEFMPVLTKALASATSDKKLLDKIANGLSIMDKNAEIQRDRKGRIIYDKETKDTELVKWEESIEDYMAREVLPHIPDAAAFFEEDLGKKKPVIKTGAEIPFTRYFYKYQASTPSEELETKFMELEFSVSKRVAKLFE